MPRDDNDRHAGGVNLMSLIDDIPAMPDASAAPSLNSARNVPSANANSRVGCATDGPTLPTIEVGSGELAPNVSAGIAALRARGASIYDRGGALYRVCAAGGASGVNGVKRDDGAILLRPLEAGWVRLQLARVADWLREGSEGPQRVDPPSAVASLIAGTPDPPGVPAWPQLRAIVRHPVLMPDGQLLGHGYHSGPGLLIVAPGDWPALPSPPTRQHAEDALATLQDLLRYMPWVSEVDAAVALSMMLTAVMRPALDAAPGHAVDANSPGTGKSLLVRAVSLMATGVPAAVADYGRDPAEAAKRIDGMLLAGDAMICIDNIEAPLQGATLCQTLTEPSRRVRPLGASTMVTVPCTAMIFATGNNLSVRGDLVRRMLVCRLNAGMERPEQRSISQDLPAEVSERRRELVTLCQTITAAYLAARRPEIGLCPLGSYGEWSSLVRAPLVWAGAHDPAAVMDRLRADDPSRQSALALYSGWLAAFGDTWVTSAEVITRAGRADDVSVALRDALAGATGEVDSRKLGRWLRDHRDNHFAGMVLRRSENAARGGVYRWTVDTPAAS